MERLLIPDSPVRITRLGFGCARLFGGSELRASARLIEAALSAGIRHFDTAAAYGSEDVLGELLAGVRDVTITTKVGLPRSAARSSSPRRILGTVYRRSLRPVLARMPALKARLLRAAARTRASSPPVRRRLTRDEVLRELGESQRRLRRASIDLYLLHEPDGLEITDEVRELFESLKSQGVIGAYGLAFGGAPDSATRFGTATQCRYPPGGAPPKSDAGAAHLYHGVLRAGQQARHPVRGGGSARERIREVLASDPACAVIFSASTRQQIVDLAADP
jgi:aryl-alcohol dehydrogenase-like predicted oxidoreductase